jgi:hypothetical protein
MNAMANQDHDSFADRGRALEEEYFRKKDRELVEKMQQAASEEAARQAMGQQTGLSDPALLQELQSLGFTPDTVRLLPLVPVVQVAWAEGNVTAAERSHLVDLARARGIAEGTPADRQLAEWLRVRPDDDVFTRATRLIRALLDAPADQSLAVTADDLVSYCEKIAAASGGILGIGRVSGEERAMIQAIAAALKGRS